MVTFIYNYLENHKNVLSNRNEWHWSFLGIQPNDKMYLEVLSQIIDMVTINWSGSLHNSLTSTIRASLDVFHVIEKNLKPTPAKFYNVFNPRQLYKIVYGLADWDPSYLEGMQIYFNNLEEIHLVRLWFNEWLRNYYERFLDQNDRKWLFSKMNEITRRYYEIVRKID